MVPVNGKLVFFSQRNPRATTRYFYDYHNHFTRDHVNELDMELKPS